jgi:hypothetical protein
MDKFYGSLGIYISLLNPKPFIIPVLPFSLNPGHHLTAYEILEVFCKIVGKSVLNNNGLWMLVLGV